MKPTLLKFEISGDLEPAVDHLVEILKFEGFGVLSRSSLREHFVMLQSFYPRSAYEDYLSDPDSPLISRCAVLAQEVAPGKIEVQIRRRPHHEEAVILTREVDQRLAAVAQLEGGMRMQAAS